MQRTTYRFLGGALALATILTPVLFLTARASEPDSPTAQKAPADDTKPALTVGMPAPDFVLPDQDGKTHRLSDLHRYLADALDATLAGKEPPQTMTKAFGCSIKRVKWPGIEIPV